MTFPQQLKCFVQYIFLIILPVLLGFVFFSSAGRDDSHITYWPAYSLSHFGEILNYNGEKVEQSSSLLQVLILAAVNFISGINIVSLGSIITILLGAYSSVSVYRLGLKLHPQIGFFSALLTGTSAYYVYWIFGGMESTLVSLAVLWLILAYGAYLNKPGYLNLIYSLGVTILLVTVRPEMPVVLICMLMGVLAVLIISASVSDNKVLNQNLLSRLLILLGSASVICAILFIFRFCYFGSVFPQPVFAKSAGVTWEVIKNGFLYLKIHMFMSPSISIITGLTVCAVSYTAWEQLKYNRLNPYILLSLLFLATYTSFIIFSGGDWMECGRFLVHMLPVAVIFLPYSLFSMFKLKLIPRLMLILLVLVQIYSVINLAKTKSTGMPIWCAFQHYKSFGLDYGSSNFSWFERTNRVHMRDIPTIYYLDRIVQRLLDYKKNDKVNIISVQMGMAPFHIIKKHYGRVHTTDLRGLTDRFFTKCEITSHLPRNQFGLALEYNFYFENRQAIEKVYNMSRPDIVFGLLVNMPNLEDADKYGYSVIYLQNGLVQTNSKRLPGGYVCADQFIAVRKELAAALFPQKTFELDFHRLQH